MSAVQQASMFDVQEDQAAKEPTLTLSWAEYKNFKGLSYFRLDTAGGDVVVFGKNGTGKTTLEDGINWLLFGKDSANRKEFEVRPLDEYSEPVHNLESSVEAAFSFKGRVFTLKKVLTENWVQKRGSTEKTLSGLSTAYYVDGVPKKEAEYKAFIASIVDEKVFRLLTDPRYFNEQLHWEERRKILLEVCGDVSDADVIASDPKLYDLKAILGTRSLDDHRRVLKEEKGKVKKALDQIPVQIAEVQRGIASVAGVTAEGIAKDLKEARAERQAKAEELARAETGGGVADKQRRLSEISSRLLDLETEARRKHDDALRQKRLALSKVQDDIAATERELRAAEADLALLKKEIERSAPRGEQLLTQWDEVEAEEFTYSEETVCPACGQDLPRDRIQEARQKALEAFNLSKSQRLDAIEAEIADLKGQIGKNKAEQKRCTDSIDALQKKLKALRAQAIPMQADIEKAFLAKPVTQTPEYVTLASERDALQKEIEDLKAGNQSATLSIRAELQAMDQNIAALEQKAAQVQQAETAKKRIEELRTEEKRLAGEYERIMRESDLCDEAVKAKVRLLDDRINSRFEYATFKLFDVQMNGVVAECCETLYNGVPYLTNLNTGARINIGLDLINVFSEHYSFRAPVFIDNAESVTGFIPVSSQVIKLIASAETSSLMVFPGDGSTIGGGIRK